MSNFQFESLLQSSGLTAESVHNLRIIFGVLPAERKIELMEDWPRYLDHFLAIEQKWEEERRANIELALAKMESIINDALERDRQKALTEAKKSQEHIVEVQGAEAFEASLAEQERKKKLEMLRNIWRNTPEPPLTDPLWNL